MAGVGARTSLTAGPDQGTRAPDAPALRLRAVLCHHRCASTWLWREVLMSLALRAGETTASVNTSWRAFDEDALLGTLRFATCIGDANASARTVEVLDRCAAPYRAVHFVRDPRDLLVSAYFSHLRSHVTDGWAELAAHRERLASLSAEEGLLSEIEFNAFVLDALAGWRPRPSILELRYEEVTADPMTWIPRVVEWFEWRLDATYVRDVVERCSFERLARRPRGSDDVHHHYRKGVAGDWRNHFTERVKAAFKARYGDLLSRMGYESDARW